MLDHVTALCCIGSLGVLGLVGLVACHDDHPGVGELGDDVSVGDAQVDATGVDVAVDGRADSDDAGVDVRVDSDDVEVGDMVADLGDAAEVGADVGDAAEVGASEEVTGDTAVGDTGPVSEVPGGDGEVVDPCASGEDHDDDGVVDACDPCPEMPRILLYEGSSVRRFARAALQRVDCPFDAVDAAGLAAALDSGSYGVFVMDAPTAPADAEWSWALLDFVADGGAAVVSGTHLDEVPGPSVPATLGATWLDDHVTPRAFTRTWVHPVYTTPNDLVQAGFLPDTSSPGAPDGAPLAVVAGRVWGRFGAQPAIVESNGGRTFLDAFRLDAYPSDTDGDGVVDVVELVQNQVHAAAAAIVREGAAGAAPVGVDNAALADTFRYDLPILRGTADDAATSLGVWAGAERWSYPVVDRRWKAPVLLAPGENWVTLEAGGARLHLELDYLPQTNPREVRLVYAVASDGDGSFDAPVGEPHDLESAKRRLALGGRLLQSMLADRIAAGGLGRNTFRLRRDARGEPEVHVWKTSASTATWRAMDGLQMWSWIWGHMDELPACADCKTIIVLGMTHYDAASGQALAHTALGGGGVALFGSGTLHSWAESLGELVARLDDERLMSDFDPPLFDDSGFRGTMWANYATGLGAVLHELAHAMELPHSVPYGDIVNRGFDHVNRLIVVHEPASLVSAELPVVLPQHEPTFITPSLGRLRWHRWNALDARAYTVSSAPVITQVSGEIRIDAPAGVRALGYAKLVGDDWQLATGELQTGAAPTSYVLSKATLAFLFEGQPKIRLFVTDDQGNFNDDVIVNLP